MNNFRIRLLVGCDGLEADAGRFRYRTFTDVSPGALSICRLCKQEREDICHFLAHCPTLDHSRRLLLQSTPSSPVNLRHLYSSDSDRFVDLILGIEWIADANFQRVYIPRQSSSPTDCSPYSRVLVPATVFLLPTKRVTLLKVEVTKIKKKDASKYSYVTLA